MMARPMLCDTAARFVLPGTIVALFSGCVSYRVYEIDATSAQRFTWSGKILVVERSSPEIGPFLTYSSKAEISRVELVGANDRNIVIVLRDKNRGGRLLAKVQDAGRPPDQILSLLIQDDPVLMQMATNAVNSAQPSEENSEGLGDLITEYLRTSAPMQNREFSEVTGKQLAFACASSPAMHVETVYRIDSDTLVRVHVTDRTLLHVAVEDVAGRTLHQYQPEELSVVEVESPSK